MTSKEIKRKPTGDFNNDVVENKFLVLHNDDVHSFEFVTLALIEICDHSLEQATQCTMITHYKGKCDVKKGGIKALKPLKEALIERKLNATID